MQLVNTAILKQPLNWIIVLLMLVIAGIAGHLILSYFETEPAKGTTSGPSTVQQ
jgi:hypothetical protein